VCKNLHAFHKIRNMIRCVVLHVYEEFSMCCTYSSIDHVDLWRVCLEAFRVCHPYVMVMDITE